MMSASEAIGASDAIQVAESEGRVCELVTLLLDAAEALQFQRLLEAVKARPQRAIELLQVNAHLGPRQTGAGVDRIDERLFGHDSEGKEILFLRDCDFDFLG